MLFLKVQGFELTLDSSIVQDLYAVVHQTKSLAQVLFECFGHGEVLVGEFAKDSFVNHGGITGKGINFISLHYRVTIVMPIDDQLGLALPAAKGLLKHSMDHEDQKYRHTRWILHQNEIITTGAHNPKELEDLDENSDKHVEQVEYLWSFL